MIKSKHVIIGTAGHVDHGKTSLIKALTGIDTDRLNEEKKRGITIESGFAHLDLPGGLRAGVVDVPGHERFIKNMLAGSAGVDIAMLIVALDDGVMPQTIEHLDILRLLNIRHGLVVLTKGDLVDNDWSDLVKEDVTRLIKDTFLEHASIIKVSSYSGDGLEELKLALAKISSLVKSDHGHSSFRLPLDRVFSQEGAGTVAAGTLLDSSLKITDDAMIYPAQIPVKIRGLQVHSETVATAWPGQRVAVNLNIKKDMLNRGDVLAAINSMAPTMMLDVRLECLSNSPFPIKNNSWVHLYLGAREEIAKVILLTEDELSPGESAYAQLRMKNFVAAKKDDRFVVRFYSPLATIGGGIILDALPQKRRRRKEIIIKHFEIKETGCPFERLELAIMESPGKFSSLSQLLMRAGLDRKRIKNDANILEQKGLISALSGDIYIHKKEMERLKEKLIAFLSQWHKNNPFSLGMPLGEMRQRLMAHMGPTISDALFKVWEKNKTIIHELGFIRLSNFQVQVNEEENELIEKISSHYQSYGMTPLALVMVEPADNPAAERKRQAAFSALLRTGELIRLNRSYYMHKKHYEKALAAFKSLAGLGPVSLGQFRDELNTSRKVAVAILEYFDTLGITKVLESGRVLR